MLIFPCQQIMHFPKCNIKYNALLYIIIYSMVTTQHYLTKQNFIENFQNVSNPKRETSFM